MPVAGVLDHFSHSALQYEFPFTPLPPDPEGWRMELQERPPAMLFVESAWRGQSGLWQGQLADLAGPSPHLVELVKECRRRDIPTVFWSKEDPPNFEYFVGAAAVFDHVYTVDEGSVDRYRGHLSHERIGVLPFAAQPRLHNPIAEAGGRSDRFAFAGTYYRQKYPERRAQMETVLGPARRYGLDIYSRTQSSGNYRWPRKYRKHVVGTVPYEEMVRIYKRYLAFLNVGSVADSTTMCPRRVFELLACATPLLSSRLRAIESIFGEDVVAMTSSSEESEMQLRSLLSEGTGPTPRAIEGLRSIFRAHTYGHRIDQVLHDVLGVAPAPRPKVQVLHHVESPDQFAVALQQAHQIASSPGVDGVVIGGPGTNSSEAPTAGPVRTSGDKRPRREWTRRAVSRVEAKFVCITSADHGYSAHFFQDLLDAAEYAVDAQAFGSPLEGAGSAHPGFAYVDALDPDTVMLPLGTAGSVGLPHDGAEFASTCRAAGIRMFAVDTHQFARREPGPTADQP